MKYPIPPQIKGAIAFVVLIWGVFLLDIVLPFDLTSWGVTPRTWRGLAGIPAMPFVHGSWQHIVSNTLPLLVLLSLLQVSMVRSWEIVTGIVLLSGGLLWLFGRTATHVGASGLVFGLIAFLMVTGWLERRLVSLLIAVVVTCLYGGSLFWGVVPRIGTHVSWDGHLLGVLAGGILAFALTKTSKPPATRTEIAPR